MTRTNWKRERANSVQRGLQLDVQHAKAALNLSVERIAERVEIPSQFTLYKYLESGRMPAILIPAFEKTCGAHFLTQFLAHGANKLLIDFPTGRRASHRELNEVGAYAHQVLGMLIDFYEGRCEQEEVEGALTLLIEDLAYQRGNIAKHRQPELLLR